jgi:hypothetical protein
MLQCGISHKWHGNATLIVESGALMSQHSAGSKKARADGAIEIQVYYQTN